MKETIRHDEERHRFVIALRGEEALLAYSQKGNVLDFYRTFVPEGFRGRGLAEKIVKSGPFLKRHEEYRTLIVDRS